MKNNIQSIEDIRAERANLKNKLALSQLHMHTRVQAIQQELNPARQALGVVKDVFARPRKGLLYVGVGIGVDLLLRRRLLKKAGWLPRLVVPFLVQNAAANVIQRNSTSFLEKGLKWFKKATDKR